MQDYITELQNGTEPRDLTHGTAQIMISDLIERASEDGRTDSHMALRGVRCYTIHLYSGRTDFGSNELGVGTAPRGPGTWTANSWILGKIGDAGDAAFAKSRLRA